MYKLISSLKRLLYAISVIDKKTINHNGDWGKAQKWLTPLVNNKITIPLSIVYTPEIILTVFTVNMISGVLLFIRGLWITMV